MKKLLLFLLLLSCYCLQGQNNPDIKRTYHWYFGNGAGIDFSSGTAVADTNGKLNLGSSLGCSVISDTSGNLLFYTDGKTVYNKNHVIMPNGTGLSSLGSSHQSCIIIPKPLSTNIFYIFTTDGFENGGTLGLRYSTVDINADGGLGDVIEKNTLLFNPNSEILAAIKHNNCKDIWVVAHERYSNCFRAYLVKETGVDTVPTISCIGHAGQYSPYGYILKFSPDGSKAVTSSPGTLDSLGADIIELPNIDLMNFNNISGGFSNLISLQTDTFICGLSFSPNSNKLYVFTFNIYIDPSRVYQFDVSVWDSSYISLSKQFIIPPNSNYQYGDFQIAPDNKIITTVENFSGNSDTIAIIKNPNATGLACNYENHGLYLNGKTCTYSLPNFIESYFDTVNCYTGIQETLENENKIIVYPNPFYSATFINIPDEIKNTNAELIIYNSIGKNVVYKKINDNPYMLSRGNLQNGIYLLKLQLNDKIYITKIIITN